MGENSLIEWTDSTWNPITGCSVVSPGCTNCYAMKLAGTRLKHTPSRIGLTDMSKAGPVWNGKVRFNENMLDQPLRWRKPRMIFVCAHGDLFHENVPDEWIDQVFAVMALTQQHTFQVLTKRPERMLKYMTGQYRSAMVEGNAQRIYHGRTGDDPSMWLAVNLPLPNVWIGVSVENQETADERIPLLMKTPAAIRWLSCEPLLGLVDLQLGGCDHKYYSCTDIGCWSGLDWIVAGGESQTGARPSHPDWFRSLRDGCAEADIPFFFKQWGEWYPGELEIDDGGEIPSGWAAFPDCEHDPNAPDWEGSWKFHRFDDGGGMLRVGKKRAGSMLDGVEIKEYPAGHLPRAS